MKRGDKDRKDMKKFTFKGVLDGFRSSVQQSSRPDQEIHETLRSEHFDVKKVSPHYIVLILLLLFFFCAAEINFFFHFCDKRTSLIKMCEVKTGSTRRGGFSYAIS